MELTDHLVPKNQVLGPLNVVKLTNLLWRRYIIKMPQIARTPIPVVIYITISYSLVVAWLWHILKILLIGYSLVHGCLQHQSDPGQIPTIFKH